jgi:hypothetical protein
MTTTTTMIDDRWSMVDGRWSMVDGRWSMVDDCRNVMIVLNNMSKKQVDSCDTVDSLE